jgi:hypothetical protein
VQATRGLLDAVCVVVAGHGEEDRDVFVIPGVISRCYGVSREAGENCMHSPHQPPCTEGIDTGNGSCPGCARHTVFAPLD